MGCVIDSCVLISQERGRDDLTSVAALLGDEEFYLSVISVSELLHGVHRAVDAGVRNRRSAFVEAILREFPILEIDINAARIHAEIWAELGRAGTPIGSHDLWIAASCLAHGHSLVTNNVSEFSRVPGLRVLPVSEG
jgi:tRNA(fMet)-specific endonuclease VapC